MVLKILIILVILLILCGLPYRVDVTHNDLKTGKIRRNVRFAVLADLHDFSFGREMERILDPVSEEKPDFILIPGDLFDDERSGKHVWKLISSLCEKYPVYYCSGNHEEYRKDVRKLMQKLKDAGVTVLDEKADVLTVRNETIELAGISDQKKQKRKAEEISRLFHTDRYRILMSHRPQFVDLYSQVRCDLVVCGHAHGGLWCLPKSRKGFYAPQQGFFPKYTHDLYPCGDHQMLVSRGLARTSRMIPRLYNNPEINIVTLIPEKEEEQTC